jgi:hypothetical protein
MRDIARPIVSAPMSAQAGKNKGTLSVTRMGAALFSFPAEPFGAMADGQKLLALFLRLRWATGLYDLKGSFTLIQGTPELAYSRGSLRVEKSDRRLGAKRSSPMGVAGWRLAQVKKTFSVRAALIGLLEELPFICPVVVAVGSTVMIVLKLCKDLPQ